MILRLPTGMRFFPSRRAVATEAAREPSSGSAASPMPRGSGVAPPLTDDAPPADGPADALPPGCGLTVKWVDDQVHFAAGVPVVYVQNHKAACTSMKFSLLLSILPEEQISDSALHWRGEGPFARTLSACTAAEVNEILGRPAFTVVRNPYPRILSAYLNKVSLSQPEGQAFYRRFFLQPTAEERIGFVDFLRCVASDHPRTCNPHFGPQYVNTLAHHIDYDFIGSIENTGAIADYLRGHGVALEPWIHHSTHAATLLETHFTGEAEALADAIFAEDFRLFGYPRGLARAQEPPTRAERAPCRGVALAKFAANPEECAQPGTREVEAMRRFERSRDPAERRAIAEDGVAFSDWRAVKALAKAMTEANVLELAYPLLDRLTLLLTAHMDHVPERLLSAQGRTLKRLREEILAR